MATSLMADLLEEMKNHRFSEVHITLTHCRFHVLDHGGDVEIIGTSSVPMALKMLKALREGA